MNSSTTTYVKDGILLKYIYFVERSYQVWSHEGCLLGLNYFIGIKPSFLLRFDWPRRLLSTIFIGRINSPVTNGPLVLDLKKKRNSCHNRKLKRHLYLNSRKWKNAHVNFEGLVFYGIVAFKRSISCISESDKGYFARDIFAILAIIQGQRFYKKQAG